MTRLLVLLALILIIAYVASNTIARLRSQLGEVLKDPTPGSKRTGIQLVACAACGVHIPRSRAVFEGRAGRSEPTALYCSEQCRGRSQRSANDVISSRSA